MNNGELCGDCIGNDDKGHFCFVFFPPCKMHSNQLECLNERQSQLLQGGENARSVDEIEHVNEREYMNE